MRDFQCILCKYKNNEDKCMEAIERYDFECPSLSNIFYGKIIKIPVIKQIYQVWDKINDSRFIKQYEKDYINEYETQNMKFIWGVKSWDDLSSAKSANLYTMNDIDLIYLKDENKYILGIETMFMFKEEKHKLNYLTGCLKAFTEFMKDNGYNTEIKPFWMDVFSYGWNINTHFDSIEDCYAMFKLLVNGYCSD